MAVKQLAYDQEAREYIRAGVTKLAKAVKVTYGPRGRNAVIDKGWGSPTFTKDGVTVAEEVELENPYEDMGAQLVKEAATKTSDVAGDGTTTATVLAEAIFLEAHKFAASGARIAELARGIRAGDRRGRRGAPQDGAQGRRPTSSTSSRSPRSPPTATPRSAR